MDSRAHRHLAWLRATGIASLGLYGFAARGLRATNRPADVYAFLAVFGLLCLLYGLACWKTAGPSAARGVARRLVFEMLLFAAAFRLLMLPAGLDRERPLTDLLTDLGGREVVYGKFLLYDNDVWRYLWDGAVGNAGLDPYAASPRELAQQAFDEDDPQGLLADEHRQDVLDNVSFQDYVTVYPPLAQLLFRTSDRLAPSSVAAWKLGLIAADLLTCWLLVSALGRLGRPPTWAILYAWHPVAVKELAGSGHVDGWAILLLTLAVWLLAGRLRLAAVAALTASALVKLGPAVLLAPWIAATGLLGFVVADVVAGLGVLVHLEGFGEWLAALAAYGGEWVFNPGPWALLRWLAGALGAEDPAAVAHWIGRLLVLAAALVVAWRARGADAAGLIDQSLPLLAVLLLLNAAVFPWYLLWALPLSALVGDRSWPLLCASSLLSYLFYIDSVDAVGPRLVEYGLFFALLLWARLRRDAGVTSRAASNPPSA